MDEQQLISLNEQIAAMARAGLPLSDGLRAFARDMAAGRLRSVTSAIATDLQAGRTLPEAIADRGDRLPPYYAGLIQAGIRSGRLADVLATLTAHARSVAAARMMALDALLYPAIVGLFAVGLYGLLMFFVVPQFEDVFDGFGLKLPLVTRAVFALSRYTWWVLAGLAAAVVGLGVTWTALRLSPGGRATAARAVYSVPLAGTLVRSLRLAAFADLLAVLVEYEVPLDEAFELAGRASADPVMALNARAVADSLAAGVPLAEAFRGRGLVPEWVSWMAGVGERQGTLAGTLRQVAVVYRRQAEARASVIRSVLPPLLVLGTATVMFGLFGVAVMLPMVNLLEGLGK